MFAKAGYIRVQQDKGFKNIGTNDQKVNVTHGQTLTFNMLDFTF